MVRNPQCLVALVMAVMFPVLAAKPAPAVAQPSAADGGSEPAVGAGEPYLLRSAVKGDEFSILMPSQPTAIVSRLDFSFKVDGQVIDEERIFSSYADGAVFLVRVLITSDGKKAFDQFLSKAGRRDEGADGVSARDITLGGYKGRQEEMHGKTYGYGERFYSRVQYFATKRNLYIVSATARDENNPSIGGFFASLRLGDMTAAGDVPSTPSKGLPAAAANAAPAGAEAGRVLKPDEVTRKPVIVWRPDPAVYEEVLGLNGPIFKVKLQMVLSADGQVREVKILSGLTQAINEKVVTSAKHTRFIPAEKDGRPVSQWHTAEYVFRR